MIKILEVIYKEILCEVTKNVFHHSMNFGQNLHNFMEKIFKTTNIEQSLWFLIFLKALKPTTPFDCSTSSVFSVK